MICVAQPCTEHEHPQHPGVGHCAGCLDDRNEGYDPLHLFTMRDEEPACCCRGAEREAAR